MELARCGYCGARREGRERACLYCGTRLEPLREPAPRVESEKPVLDMPPIKYSVFIAGLMGVALITVGLLLWMEDCPTLINPLPMQLLTMGVSIGAMIVMAVSYKEKEAR